MSDKKETEKKEETKREKFVRLASDRTNKALDRIAILQGLTAKANYEYTDADWETILSALCAEVDKLEQKIKNPTAVAEVGFKLGS